MHNITFCMITKNILDIGTCFQWAYLKSCFQLNATVKHLLENSMNSPFDKKESSCMLVKQLCWKTKIVASLCPISINTMFESNAFAHGLDKLTDIGCVSILHCIFNLLSANYLFATCIEKYITFQTFPVKKLGSVSMAPSLCDIC